MNTKNALMGILIVVVFAVGFMVGRFSSGSSVYVSGSPQPTASAPEDTEGTKGGDVAQEGTTIEAANLSEGQKKLLSALGIDADSITVTPEMVVCAEAGLGPARIDEITSGATPSFTEGLKLAGCYK